MSSRRSRALVFMGLSLVAIAGCKSNDDGGGAGGSGGRGGSGGSRTGGSGGKGGSGGSGGSAAGSGGSGGDAGMTGSGGSGTGGTAGDVDGSAGTGVDAGDMDAAMSGADSGAGGTGGASMGAHAKMIKLDTTAAGAAVMGDVAKYPVAVILSATNFDFTQAKSKGEDIRFAAMDGTALPYAIESWDATAKTAALWVKVDVKGNAVTQIKMSWGDPAATDASDSHKVFDTADGFAGVWHLNEPGSATMGAYKDSTSNAADATGIAMTADGSAPGRVGTGVLLAHAQKQWVEVGLEKSKLFDMPDKMTYSVWVNSKSHTVSYQCMLSKGEGSFRIHYVGTAFVVETCAEGTIDGDLCPVNEKGTQVTVGKWFHLLAVHDRPRHAIYVNGALQAEVTDDDEPWTSDPTKPVMIGNNSSVIGRSFDGFMDEARIMNVPKDANWIKLEYESQREDQKFLTFDAGN